MMIYVQRDSGDETPLEHVSIRGGHELPPTRGGLRDTSDINLTVPYPSPDFDVLSEISKSEKPLRLRRGNDVALWLILEQTAPSDGLVHMTLCSARFAPESIRID